MNIIDILACLYYVVDQCFNFGNFSEVYSVYYRFFKIFYVLRLWKLLKKLEYMKIIKYVFRITYSSFIFILFLNILAISVYSILGMQLYKDKFDEKLEINLIRNFNDFQSAFIAVFSIITMDNWDSILIECMKDDQVIGAFYVLSLIFFLGFMMFNLLTTVLIHGFENLLQGIVTSKGGKLQDEYDLFKVKQVLLKYTSFKEKMERNSNNFNTTLNNEMFENYNFFKSKGSSNTNRATGHNFFMNSAKCFKFSSNERITKTYFEQLIKQKKFYLINFDCNNTNTCLIFHEENILRILSHKINNSRYFERFSYLITLNHTFFICFETFLNYSNDSNVTLKQICHYNTLVSFYIFSFESLIKSIDLGFILKSGAYLRSPSNILNFLSVVFFHLENSFYFMNENEFLRITKWSFFRIIKTINIIYQNEKMKLLLGAIFKSLRGLFSVSLVVLTVW